MAFVGESHRAVERPLSGLGCLPDVGNSSRNFFRVLVRMPCGFVWFDKRRGGPSTSRHDSLSESRGCAQDDIWRRMSFISFAGPQAHAYSGQPLRRLNYAGVRDDDRERNARHSKIAAMFRSRRLTVRTRRLGSFWSVRAGLQCRLQPRKLA
jgi:hypothetical protein